MKFIRFIDKTSLAAFLIIALTLGLAPFVPQPHVVEKITMLFSGELSKPIDIFDLLLHGTPWALLAIKLFRLGQQK
jgi:hypothetical protein